MGPPDCFRAFPAEPDPLSQIHVVPPGGEALILVRGHGRSPFRSDDRRRGRGAGAGDKQRGGSREGRGGAAAGAAARPASPPVPPVRSFSSGSRGSSPSAAVIAAVAAFIAATSSALCSRRSSSAVNPARSRAANASSGPPPRRRGIVWWYAWRGARAAEATAPGAAPSRASPALASTTCGVATAASRFARSSAVSLASSRANGAKISAPSPEAHWHSFLWPGNGSTSPNVAASQVKAPRVSLFTHFITSRCSRKNFESSAYISISPLCPKRATPRQLHASPSSPHQVQRTSKAWARSSRRPSPASRARRSRPRAPPHQFEPGSRSARAWAQASTWARAWAARRRLVRLGRQRRALADELLAALARPPPARGARPASSRWRTGTARAPWVGSRGTSSGSPRGGPRRTWVAHRRRTSRGTR